MIGETLRYSFQILQFCGFLPQWNKEQPPGKARAGLRRLLALAIIAMSGLWFCLRLSIFVKRWTSGGTRFAYQTHKLIPVCMDATESLYALLGPVLLTLFYRSFNSVTFRQLVQNAETMLSLIYPDGHVRDHRLRKWRTYSNTAGIIAVISVCSWDILTFVDAWCSPDGCIDVGKVSETWLLLGINIKSWHSAVWWSMSCTVPVCVASLAYSVVFTLGKILYDSMTSVLNHLTEESKLLSEGRNSETLAASKRLAKLLLEHRSLVTFVEGLSQQFGLVFSAAYFINIGLVVGCTAGIIGADSNTPITSIAANFLAVMFYMCYAFIPVLYFIRCTEKEVALQAALSVCSVAVQHMPWEIRSECLKILSAFESGLKARPLVLQGFPVLKATSELLIQTVTFMISAGLLANEIFSAGNPKPLVNACIQNTTTS